MGKVRDVVVVAASAGGAEALRELVAGLPADLPAAVCVVVHGSPESHGAPAHLLDRSGPLPAAYATDGEPLLPGRIYVAPPGRHLVVGEGGVLRTTRGPREHGLRPAADALFRSAARWLDARVVGVVVPGTLDDGVAGLDEIRRAGGLAVMEDAAGIAASLGEVVGEPAPEPERRRAPRELMAEVDIVTGDSDVLDHPPGEPGRYGCPECGGTLWEPADGGVPRFRCRVGHAWTLESLAAEQERRVEATLGVALRMIEERADLAARMADRADLGGDELTAKRLRERQADAVTAAETVKHLLFESAGAAEGVL